MNRTRFFLPAIYKLTPVAFGLLCSQVYWYTPAHSEEPAAKFLERLKEEGHYDQALKYLDVGVQRNRIPESMKADLGLERILILQLSLDNVRTAKEGEERLAAIEQGFKDFLNASPEHPRRGETMLKLADMYLARGTKLLTEADTENKKEGGQATSTELREKARVALQLAYENFGGAVEWLRPVLEAMQGANVKPNETERLALREKLRTEYRQGEILQAITTRYLAETYPPKSPEWSQKLEEAGKKLDQIAEKSSKQPGAKYLSLLNRAQIQGLLGQIDGARETYNRVAENDEPGIFRTWRVQAIAGIVRLDSSPASKKYEAAVARGEEQLRMGDLREKDRPEWLDLQLAIAEARIAWMNSLDQKAEEGKFRNIRREARETLQLVAKKPGPTQAKARDLLKDLGIETKAPDDSKLPDVKTFEEAIKVARSRLDRAEEGDATIKILERQLASASGDDKATIEEQIKTVSEEAVRDRRQAVGLNTTALAMFDEKDSRDDLLQTRFLQAYLLWQLEDYWESFAIADVILRTNKGTETAQKASSLALSSLGQLIDNAPSERQATLTVTLEKLAKYLLDTAPGTPESDQAVDILVSLALREKKWDEAERYLKMKETPGGDKAFLLGRVFWAQYRQNVYAHRQAGTQPTADDDALRQRGEKLLSDAWNTLTPEQVATGSLEGTNDLTSLYLQGGRLDEALATLNDPAKGAIKQAESLTGTLEPAILLDTYRLTLQSMVQSAGQGRGELSEEQVADAIGKMKSLCDQAGDDTMLTRCLQNLAAELQGQLEANKNGEQQAKLATSFKVVIDQLINVSNDPGMIESGGAAMLLLATNLEKIPSMAAKAPSLMESAEKAFSKLKGMSDADLEKIKRKPEEILLKLALAKRGAKKFEEANGLFIEALRKNANNITIQIEAARNLQQWAGSKDSEKLKQAMLGAEPLPNKKKLIWGWGQIAQTTSKYPNFQKEFFDARLNVARCRAMLGDNQTGDAEKQKLYEAAISDINTTAVRFPELGGPETFKEFDKLLREIQQKAKKPITGITPAAASGTKSDANGPADPGDKK
jgi:hypothetical protein